MRSVSRTTLAKRTTKHRRPGVPGLPPLENGDRLTQAEFHRRYEAYPEDVKFELIGGTVYMTSPLRLRHGSYHVELALAFGHYKSGSPGVEAADNATAILGEESEPQPDLTLRILPEYGGRSRMNQKQYLVGPPELFAEIAHSTVAMDMHQKRDDYQRAEVLEYLVVCIEEQELHWFDFKSRRLITPDARGIYRSRVFPGLWIDGPALLTRDSARLIAAVQLGLASPEHVRFVKRLQSAQHKRSPR